MGEAPRAPPVGARSAGSGATTGTLMENQPIVIDDAGKWGCCVCFAVARHVLCETRSACAGGFAHSGRPAGLAGQGNGALACLGFFAKYA